MKKPVCNRWKKFTHQRQTSPYSVVKFTSLGCVCLLKNRSKDSWKRWILKPWSSIHITSTQIRKKVSRSSLKLRLKITTHLTHISYGFLILLPQSRPKFCGTTWRQNAQSSSTKTLSKTSQKIWFVRKLKSQRETALRFLLWWFTITDFTVMSRNGWLCTEAHLQIRKILRLGQSGCHSQIEVSYWRSRWSEAHATSTTIGSWAVVVNANTNT